MEYLNILTIALCAVVGFISLQNEKKAIQFIVFSLSFLVPFQTEVIPIGLPGALIVTVSIVKALQQRHTGVSLNKISKKFTLLYYLLIVGILTGLFNTATGADFADGKTSNLSQVVRISSYIIILILFVKILVPFRNDFLFQNKLLKVFCLSVLIHTAGYFLFENLPFASALFYHAESDSQFFDADITRYCSLIGDYELTIDYLLIVIGCSLLLYSRQKKLWNLAFIVPAVWIGIITGTRSFIVVGGLFVILFMLFHMRGFKLFFSLAVTVIISFLLVSKISYLSSFAPSSTLFVRLEQTVDELKNNGSVAHITNRDFSKAADELVTNTGFLGNGAFFFNKFQDNEMVSHNLFLAMYAKYGLPGLLVLIAVFLHFARSLFKVIKKPAFTGLKTEAKILLFLLICLIVQELKISAIRNLSVILVYSFMFFMAYCLTVKNKSANIPA